MPKIKLRRFTKTASKNAPEGDIKRGEPILEFEEKFSGDDKYKVVKVKVGENDDSGYDKALTLTNSLPGKGILSSAEGNNTKATGDYSHAEGWVTKATGTCAHAEGYQTEAAHDDAHAEGYQTKAYGKYSHAEGNNTIAGDINNSKQGQNAHVEGLGTKAPHNEQHVQGRYNKVLDDNYLHIVGNGTGDGDNERSNAHTLDKDGNAWFAGTVKLGANETEVATKEDIQNIKFEANLQSDWNKTEDENGGIINKPEIYNGNGTKAIIEGEDTIAGIKAFKIQTINDNIITVTNSTTFDQLAVDDKITIMDKDSKVYIDIYEIASKDINTKTITLKKDTNGSFSIINNATYFCVLAKPQVGSMVYEGTDPNSQSNSHAEGYRTRAIGKQSHAEGGGDFSQKTYNVAAGPRSHAEGYQTQAIGSATHAEGTKTTANGSYSHAEGQATTANGSASHAEGYRAQAIGLYSHAEGDFTVANGARSHAEGNGCQATNNNAHAEGYKTQALGTEAHAEGIETIASGTASHAEGKWAKAYGKYSHAEGFETVVGKLDSDGIYVSNTAPNGAHAEGYKTIAEGEASHAEGHLTKTVGISSHAEGIGTIAQGNYQHVQGTYNEALSDNYLHIVGNGTGDSDDKRSNAHTLDKDGNAWFAGNVTAGGLVITDDAIYIRNTSGYQRRIYIDGMTLKVGT